MNDTHRGSSLSRRSFLTGTAAAGALAAFSLSGCAPQSATEKGTALASSAQESAAVDWLGEPPAFSDSDVVKTYEADVIVAGAGTSGMFAACSVVENGASCIAIDKATADVISDGIRDTLGAVGSAQQLEDGANPNRFDVINELVRQSNGYGDDRLYHLWADLSGEAIDWYTARLAEKGTNFMHEIDEPLHTRFAPQEVGHSIQWEDTEYSKQYASSILLEYGVSKGLELHNETSMKSLIKEDGRVVGLYAESPEGLVRYNAKNGVIVSTGGYASNADMMEALQPHSEELCCIRKSFPTCEGDGIKACLWAGGHMDETHAAMIFDRGGIKADATDTTDGALFWMGSQPFLKVDLNGNRFTNESGFYDHVLHTSFNLPHQTYCMIWDANYQDDIKRFETHGCSRLYPHANGAEPVMSIDVIDSMNKSLMEKGYIMEADTIEGLAEKLGISAQELAATATRYNKLADNGEDVDFGKEAFRLSHLDTPPFRGIRMQGGYLITTLDGIKIDTTMHVVDENEQAIPGLYCSGDCSGGYFCESYPNLLAGAAAGRSVTFGRYAGKLAAAGE